MDFGTDQPWSAIDLAKQVNDRAVAPGAGVARAHATIIARNPSLNAFVDYDPDAAVPQVAQLESRLRTGDRPPLSGVPIAVKDHIQVAGWRVTEGSLLFRDRVAPVDEPVIARLRAAGAIIIGRTNMSEFGCKGVTTNRIYNATRHPMDPSLTPGGSSGGAASAVAAGLIPLALASDGGGSVRRPAAHVGVVGFKPSTGVIADPRSPSHISVFGGMASSVRDMAALFEVLAGRDRTDPVSTDLAGSGDAMARPFRMAWSPRLGLDVAVDRDVEDGLGVAIERLREIGLSIENVDPEWPSHASEDALMPLQHAQLASAFGAIWRDSPDSFDPDVGDQIERGLALSGTDVCRAQEMSMAIACAAARFFAEGYDVLLSPTTPCVAWPLSQLGPNTIGGVPGGARGHAVFTPFFNHAFCPAISVPAGRGRAGLPIGLQIAGSRFSDRSVLRAAAVVEAALTAR